MSYNLSSIPAGSTINGITLPLYGRSKINDFTSSTLSGTITNASPTNWSAWSYSDFNKAGNTAYGNYTYEYWTKGVYNNASFNSEGVSGFQSRIGTNASIMYRNTWDYENTQPVWVADKTANLGTYSIDAAGTSTDPFITIVYTNEGGAPTAPVSSFTANATSGTTSLAVLFTDSSTNTPTSWNWSFQNVTGNNTQVWWTTTQSPTLTFGVGNFSIVLNASNAGGYDLSNQITFINVSAGAAGSAPVASFTTSSNLYRIPSALVVTDTSANTPTMWNWSWGDNTWTNGTTASPTHTYTTRGSFSVSLLCSNAFGSDTVDSPTTIRVVGYENSW
jgi:PKD repeat protein